MEFATRLYNALYKQAGVILPEASDEEVGGWKGAFGEDVGLQEEECRVEGVRGRRGNFIRREKPSFRPLSR